MNSARLRRPEIRKRARAAMIRRLHAEYRERKDQIIVVPRVPRLQARLYLRTPGIWFEDDYAISVVVDLPADQPTRKLQEMQVYGFWVSRPDKGFMRFIPPHNIMQVRMEVS